MTHQHKHISDQQLLDNFHSSRDNQWLGILFERYTLLLFGVCMKYLKNEDEAKDGVQQVFLKAITELHKYRVQYFKSWLYMVTKNHCLMRIREKQTHTPEELNEQQAADPADPFSVHKHIEKDRRLEIMEGSIAELNEEQKQCVTLFYLHKKSYQEISESTGYSTMQVKSYIQNGKRNLRILIEKKIQQP